MITSQCGKLPCVQRTGSLPQRHYFSILRPRCKGAGRISGKVLAMLGRFCPRFPPSPRRFVKIVGNRPARHVLDRLPRFGPVGAGAQPAVPGYAVRLPYIVGRAFTPAGGLAAARKDIGKARRRTPQSALPTAPLTGEPSGQQFSQSLPCKGLRSRAPPAAEKARRSRCSGRRTQVCFSARSAMRAPQTGRWMRRKAQTEGCIAALRRRYPAKPGRALSCAS